jgi:hypothetical protein
MKKSLLFVDNQFTTTYQFGFFFYSTTRRDAVCNGELVDSVESFGQDKLKNLCVYVCYFDK